MVVYPLMPAGISNRLPIALWNHGLYLGCIWEVYGYTPWSAIWVVVILRATCLMFSTDQSMGCTLTAPVSTRPACSVEPGSFSIVMVVLY